MSRESQLVLADIENACAKVIRYCGDLPRDAVFAEEMRLDALLFNLHIIGEAAKKLPSDLRERYADVPWRELSGMRDIIVHAYFALDLDIIWDAIQNDVPRLLERVRDIITIEDGS